MVSNRDTIIAPATPVGNSGIAVVRISGDQSLSFLHTCFRAVKSVSEYESHRFYLGKFHDATGDKIDEIMAVYMAAPRTYTGEPVVELHCHGSRRIVSDILETAHHHGIRLAQPGEFTYRAYLTGRLDLVQAEAVSRLIQSSTEFSRKSALQQLDGVLSRQIHTFSSLVKNVLVHIEAWIDFPEEDLPKESVRQIKGMISDVHRQMTDLAATYQKGQYIHTGATVALAGLPNAGKSSLMNALLQRDRSIVSPVPGTTRDTIEQSFQFNGIEIRLVDTAGLRGSGDLVEQEGVRRARAVLDYADIILLVFDGSASLTDDFVDLVHSYCNCSSLLIVNKSDIVSQRPILDFYNGPVVHVSAKYGDGISELKDKLVSLLLEDYLPGAEPSYLTEQRHYDALTAATGHLQRFLSNVEHVDVDLLSMDLRDCLHELASITGQVTTESILDDIFSSFCIGK